MTSARDSCTWWRERTHLSNFSFWVVFHFPLFSPTFAENPFISCFRRQKFTNSHTIIGRHRMLLVRYFFAWCTFGKWQVPRTYLNASAKILLKPRTKTTVGDNPPPAAPATMANEVKIPSNPPKMIGLRKPPSDWCQSSSLSLLDRTSWKFLKVLTKIRDMCIELDWVSIGLDATKSAFASLQQWWFTSKLPHWHLQKPGGHRFLGGENFVHYSCCRILGSYSILDFFHFQGFVVAIK